jgi:hypothetical protein
MLHAALIKKKIKKRMGGSLNDSFNMGKSFGSTDE